MLDPGAAPVESSTTTAPPDSLSAMTESALDTWKSQSNVEESGTPTQVYESAEPETGKAEPAKPAGNFKTKEDTAERINQLLAERNQAQAELREAKAKLEPKKSSPPAETQKIERPVKPVTLDNFDGSLAEWEAAQQQYIEDLSDYKVETALEKLKEGQKAESTAKKQIDKWHSKVNAAKESFPDYEAIAYSAEVPISEAMDEYLQTEENGAKVLYLLGKYPAEAKRIASLPRTAAIKALSKLEDSLEVSEVRKPVAQISQASRPGGELPRGSGLPKDPSMKAVEDGDVGAFLAAEKAKEQRRRA